MSSSFRPLLRFLFDGVGQTVSPCFTVADLNAISLAGFDLLRTEKVLVKTGVSEEMAHPVHGHVAIRKIADQWYLVDLADPARDWIKVDADEVERFRFSHQGLVRWIARQCGTQDEVHLSGAIWTVGVRIVQDQRCRILYYPGTAALDSLLAAIRGLETHESGIPRLLLLPFASPIEASELSRLEQRGLFLDHLYRLASENGIDIELARLPVVASARKPGYFFRRVKGSNSWEVGFNTTTPIALPRGVAMDRIWLLLRNPGKSFTASDITNQLNATSDDRSFNRKTESTDPAYHRSSGTSARTIKDLTTDQQADGKDILREVMRTKSDFGKGSHQHKDAEKEWSAFIRKHGLVDVYRGIVNLENDDVTKEAETMKKSIERWITQHRDSGLGDLVRHIDTTILRGTSFSYSPPKEQPQLQWQT